MTVTYAPGGDGRKPMVRIANSLLVHAGFAVGTPIKVSYTEGLITIKKIN
jgi:hypothetical protein